MVLLDQSQAAWRPVQRVRSALVRQLTEFKLVGRTWWCVVRQKVVLHRPQWPVLHECGRCAQSTINVHRAPLDRLT